jgi:class 3 adenylate cyclase/tetratricopeptide (TPR) repeat protein
LTGLRRWLEDHGLKHHADLFERWNIDFSHLINLGETDLVKLGLAPAARSAILQEIANTRAVAPATSVFSDRAERRQLTIMFCDLVDSVGLSVRLDPEDLRDLIVSYQSTCAHSVEHYGGYVARYVGDGILAYFGYPVAHDDNAERAIRAALDVVDGVGKLRAERFSELNIRVRVGIATGVVVVGDANMHGIADHDAVVGEAANIAARLQGIAPPDTVGVSDVTRQLALEGFEYRDMGRRDLKGFPSPMAVYQVTGQRELTRLEARGDSLTSFVGRQEEIAILLDRWRRAVAQNGQVVALVGPAGIGKSRIVAEAIDRIRQQNEAAPPAVVLQCSPYHLNMPFYPIVRYLTRLADINAQDSLLEKVEKVAILLGAHPSHHESVPLIAELLGIELGDDHPAPALTPFVRRQLTIETLLDWFAARSRKHAAMIVFEDVQWIDPTSKLLLRRLAHWAKNAATLIAFTLRADRSAQADGLLKETSLAEPDGRHADHVTVHEVRELGAVEGRKLASAAAAGDGSSIDALRLDAIVAQSGGIPLYLEQMAKTTAGGFDVLLRRTGTNRAIAVPSTIDDALMAQLDRLGAAKEVAQHAAVIGPEFQLGLLVKIVACSPDELALMIRNLEQSRIVENGGASPDSYHFKHSLIHEISYRSLLRKNRRQIHLLVAGELSGHLAEAGASNDDFIAQHYALGEAHLEAIEYWRRGAGKAIARSANEEAIAMLQSALDALGKLRGTRQPELELDLVLTQAMALRSVRGYSAPEVEEGLTRARELSARCGDFASRFSVEWGLFQCVLVKGDLERARALAAALIELTEHEAGPALVDAHLASGMVAFNAGEFEAAVGPLETAVTLCRPETDQPRFLTHGQNAGLFCLSYLARAQCYLGLVDRGRATIERARSITAMRSQDPGHIHSSLNVAIHAVRAYHLCGDLEAEKRLASEAVEVARHNHYSYYEALANCHLGWVTGMEGDLERGIAILTDGIAALRKTGTSISLTGYYLLLSQLCVLVGRREAAEEALATAAASRGQALWDAEIERVRGDIVAVDWVAAETAYRSSLAIAHRQRARLFACKAAVSLARLLQTRGRRAEGRQVLEECLAQLHEGNDVAAVRQARTLLAELKSGKEA